MSPRPQRAAAAPDASPHSEAPRDLSIDGRSTPRRPRPRAEARTAHGVVDGEAFGWHGVRGVYSADGGRA